MITITDIIIAYFVHLSIVFLKFLIKIFIEQPRLDKRIAKYRLIYNFHERMRNARPCFDRENLIEKLLAETQSKRL